LAVGNEQAKKGEREVFIFLLFFFFFFFSSSPSLLDQAVADTLAKPAFPKPCVLAVDVEVLSATLLRNSRTAGE
jgi:hypothetical protein